MRALLGAREKVAGVGSSIQSVCSLESAVTENRGGVPQAVRSHRNHTLHRKSHSSYPPGNRNLGENFNIGRLRN